METSHLVSRSSDENLKHFMAALKQCSRLGDLERAREIHAQLISCDRVSNKYIASSLISCYSKCKSMSLARAVFDGTAYEDIVSWNALLQGYVDNGENKLALEMFDAMACVPNPRSYAAAVMACVRLSERNEKHDSRNELEEKGRVLYSQAVKAGCCDKYVETELIKFFASVGDMESARMVFERSSAHGDVVTWTALLKGYVRNGEGEAALETYETMKRHGCALDARTYTVVLAACASLTAAEGRDKWLEKAETIHLEAVESGCCDVYVGNALVEMYSRSGDMILARRVFDQMPVRDVVSWNTLLQGYAENGEGETTLELFDVCVRNTRTYVACLSACISLVVKETESVQDSESRRKWFDKGKALHSQAVDANSCDIFVENVLIDLYSRCDRMEEARLLFDTMNRRDVVTWTALMKGYVDNGESETALEMFDSMENAGCAPNYRTFGVALSACGTLASRRGERSKWLRKAMALHSRAVSSGCFNSYIHVTMVHVYAAFGEMSLSRRVFDEMAPPDVVSWTALLKGYVDNGESDVALQLFHEMKVLPTARTYAVALQAVVNLSKRQEETNLKEQRISVHREILRRMDTLDVFLETGLMNMCSQCGDPVLAQLVFDNIQEPSAVSWNCLIQGYVKSGKHEQALEILSSMDSSGVELDSATYIAALAACANLLDVDRGRVFHERVKKLGLESDTTVSTCLVNFYGKCGKMELAQEIFDRIADKDVVAWNALLCGYSLDGDTERVLQVFEEMKEQGVAPDEVSFVCILTACSHSGLTEKAVECFQSMAEVHGMRHSLQHYACVVDVLGRANCSEEAMKVVRTMPYKPGDVIWSSLRRVSV